MVVAIKPMITGTKFLRASSNGLTLQIAAAGMSAHGIRTPPPIGVTVYHFRCCFSLNRSIRYRYIPFRNKLRGESITFTSTKNIGIDNRCT